MKAVISGITGQSGSYLAEHLLSLDYDVIGFSRRTSVNTTGRLSSFMCNPSFTYLEGDLTDAGFIYGLVGETKPDEFYNLGAQSHVGTSFISPSPTAEINYSGVLNVLNAIRDLSPTTKLLQASTSEMFGKNYSIDNEGKAYQDENTPFAPQSPYAIAKLAAHHSCRIYRESYDLFICCSILFNHESPRRGENFLTRKITKWIGEFLRWEKENPHYLVKDDHLVGDTIFPKLRLGNLKSYRDWGHANDYVKCQHLMLQQDLPDDYVVGTGKSYSGEDFLNLAFKCAGIDNPQDYYVIDPKFYRPCEVDFLRVNPAKAMIKLGWKPTVTFEELVKEMVDSDKKL